MSNARDYLTPENIGYLLRIGEIVAQRRAARQGQPMDRASIVAALAELEEELPEWPEPPPLPVPPEPEEG
jgi:hypothetical protein